MHVLSSVTYIYPHFVFSVRHSGTDEFLGLVWAQRRDSFCLSDWFGRNMRLGCSNNRSKSLWFSIAIAIYIYIIVYTRNLTQKEFPEIWILVPMYVTLDGSKPGKLKKLVVLACRWVVLAPESRIDTSKAIIWFNSKGGWCLVNPHCFGDELFYWLEWWKALPFQSNQDWHWR